MAMTMDGMIPISMNHADSMVDYLQLWAAGCNQGLRPSFHGGQYPKPIGIRWYPTLTTGTVWLPIIPHQQLLHDLADSQLLMLLATRIHQQTPGAPQGHRIGRKPRRSSLGSMPLKGSMRSTAAWPGADSWGPWVVPWVQWPTISNM